MKLTDDIKNKIDEFFDNKTESELLYIAEKYHTLQLHKTQVSSSTLTVPDIRNKLSPITHLIAMLEMDEIDLAKKAIEQSKISINYLAQREVY